MIKDETLLEYKRIREHIFNSMSYTLKCPKNLLMGISNSQLNNDLILECPYCGFIVNIDFIQPKCSYLCDCKKYRYFEFKKLKLDE